MVFSAFLDKIDRITVLVDKNIILQDTFKLECDSLFINLDLLEKIEEDSWQKYILGFDKIINMNKNIKITNGEYETLLYTGSFVRDPRFDVYYSYDGVLGMTYSKEKTTFRIWSPVAREIKLEITNIKGDLQIIKLVNKERGLWETTLYGDYEKAKYRYHVRIFDEFKITTDPYGISSDANGNFNYVVDKAKFTKFKFTKPDFTGVYTDSIIYEASIRDLTSKLNIENRMKFIGLIDKTVTSRGQSTGLDYIAKLGVTHLQLMPIFDFYGISDKNPERYYNWGYNPIQYFVPKGAYSTNPDDPYARINELIELIDYCHAYGLLVNMDVVYNHVNDAFKFPFDILVPGYFYRTNDGYLTNVSGCGNDIATERKMCRKFIIDNLLYLQQTYNLSGFRFDLMGLLDITTMNEAASQLKRVCPNIMLYGEGWNMPNNLPDNQRPHSLNYRYIPDYAFFNDRFRNYFKGNQWNKCPGLLFSTNYNAYDLFHLLTGSSLDHYQFDSPIRSLNYIECHDNYTVYDFFKYALHKTNESDIYDACKLGLAIVILSLGIPFIHCGQEFLRTKLGEENSYNSGDDINGVDWDRKDSYHALVQTTRDLISLRKRYKVFRISNTSEIMNRIIYLDEYSTNQTIVYKLIDEDCELFIIIKLNKKERLDIKNFNGTMIFDGSKLCYFDCKKISIKSKGIFIFRKDMYDL